MNSNFGPLEWEATTLPTESQPLHMLQFVMWNGILVYNEAIWSVAFSRMTLMNEWINEAGLSWSGLGLFSTWQVKPIRWLWAATSKHSLKKKLKSNRDKMFASFWWKGSWKEIFHWPRLVLSTCYGSYGGHHSSVDSSVPSTLWSRVQIPSATATLFPL